MYIQSHVVQVQTEYFALCISYTVVTVLRMKHSGAAKPSAGPRIANQPANKDPPTPAPHPATMGQAQSRHWIDPLFPPVICLIVETGPTQGWPLDATGAVVNW